MTTNNPRAANSYHTWYYSKILTVVSFLIGPSSFILGLRIQSAAKTITTGTISSSSTMMHMYFELLILALVISFNSNKHIRNTFSWKPSISTRCSLFATPFCSFYTCRSSIFLVKKLRVLYKNNI